MTTGNSIVYDGMTIPYDITYSQRRKSISIIVHHTKRVEIKAPTGTSASFIHGLAEKKVTWIVKRLKILDSMKILQVERKYRDGELFFFLGFPCTLSLKEVTGTGGICYNDGNITVTIPHSLPSHDHPRYTRELVQDWYRDQASRVIREEIQDYATIIGIEPPSFKLKNVRRRWGSCNHENKLNFNIRLVMAPIDLIAYVVLHELCHIRHKNHSREFWESVSEVMPDYRGRMDLLKREGHRYVL
jgi:predicted metal-dependent hydrolase